MILDQDGCDAFDFFKNVHHITIGLTATSSASNTMSCHIKICERKISAVGNFQLRICRAFMAFAFDPYLGSVLDPLGGGSLTRAQRQLHWAITLGHPILCFWYISDKQPTCIHPNYII